MFRILTHRPVCAGCNINYIIRAKRQNVIHPQICYQKTDYSTKDSDVKSVAVLGGGLTGLAAAFYLSKLAPGLPVTIYESSSRLGGWLQTRNLETKYGKVEFETGPRTLRPLGLSFLVTMDMIGNLDLGNSTILVTSNNKGATNRYVYYPDKMNRLPSSTREIFSLDNSSGLYEGLWRGLLNEIITPSRPIDLTDESVGSWVSRRIHPKISENLLSAMIHGIYAGDVDKLSMKSLFPQFWREEDKSGSVLRGSFKSLFRDTSDTLASDLRLKNELGERTKWNISYLRKERALLLKFIGGVETLVAGLVKYLEKAPNIRIRTKSTVKTLNKKQPLIEVQLTNNLPPTTFSHVISTLPAPITSSLLPTPIPPLSTVESVTVQVVNLYFPNPRLLPMRGFGYLIPKSVPLEMNPEQGLGVIFDSETSPTSIDHPEIGNEAIGTKLTVMMGGHYWDGRTTYPSNDEAVTNALNLLKRHLGIVDYPAATLVSTQKDCIPQYTVGHHSRMAFAHELMKMYFKGRVAVAGSSYNGVGMNDCTRSGYEVVRDLLEIGKPGGLAEGEWTGLSKFTEEKVLQVKI